VTDPDRRNITDQRHSDDAARRYEMRRLRQAQWLDYFGEHFGDVYAVVPPSTPGRQWHATALFGRHDRLFAWSAIQLLGELTEHRSSTHRGYRHEHRWKMGAAPAAAHYMSAGRARTARALRVLLGRARNLLHRRWPALRQILTPLPARHPRRPRPGHRE
jgi:hypothetical protein